MALGEYAARPSIVLVSASDFDEGPLTVLSSAFGSPLFDLAPLDVAALPCTARLATLRLLRFQDYANAFLLGHASPVHSPLFLAAPRFNVGDLVTFPASLCADILRQHGYSIQPNYAERKSWATRVLPGSRYLVLNLCAQAISISGRELQRFNPSRAS